MKQKPEQLHKNTIDNFTSKITNFNPKNRDTVIETGVNILEKVYSKKEYLGRDKNLTLASITYIAFRAEQEPILITDLCSVYDVSKRRLLLSYKNILQALPNITLENNEWKGYLEMFFDKLDITDTNIRSKGIRIGELSEQNNLYSGRTGRSFASGIIYTLSKVSDIHITQRELSDISSVSESTIRDIYQKQLEIYNQLEQ